MKAIIMAGGEGTRLRPLTCTIPKPMATVVGKPIMEHILRLLSQNEINDAAVTLLYLPEIIKNYFGESFLGVKLTYFEETKPLGTAGGVKNCSSFIDDTFIIISGDAACSFDLKAAVAFHKAKNADATLILTKVEEPLEYGVVLTNYEGKIERFIEKPSWSRAYSNTINTGIYILEKKCLDLIPDNMSYDFGKDLFPFMLQNNMGLYGYEANGYWCDIGSYEAYLSCNFDALDRKYNCDIGGTNFSGVFSNSFIPEKAIVVSPSYIGTNVAIGDGAVIGPHAVIGDNVIIQEGASIKKSIIGNGSFLGAVSEIRGAVLADNVVVKESARVFEGVIIGEKSTVGKKSAIEKDVRIWPEKQIADNLRVNSNVIWGNAMETLFDETGITGDTGLEMTPELAAKIGAAVCSACENKAVVIANGGGNGANMLNLSFISGALSIGGEAYDIGICAENVWRFAVKEYGAGVGAYITEGAGKTTIKLCGKNGCVVGRDLERKIESTFLREDSKRKTDGIRQYQKVGGIYGLYKNYLLSFCSGTLANVSATVHCPDKELTLAVYEALKTLKCGVNGGISAFISPDGTTLTLSDENGNYHSPEQTLAIIAFSEILLGSKALYVPYDAPMGIDLIAAANSVEVIRVLSDDSAHSKRNEHKIYTDAVAGAIRVLSAMSEKNKTLFEIANGVIPFYTTTTTVEGVASKGFIMQALSSYDGVNKELKEGIRLTLEKGTVLITPQKKGKVFVVKAEANNSEIAEEICADFEGLIKNIKEGVDFNANL